MSKGSDVPVKNKKTFCPDKILSYFRIEWLSLTFVTLSGVFYNVGLLATPWFEGRLAQCLADILGGKETAGTMAMLVLAYLIVTLTVQGARFINRTCPCFTGGASAFCRFHTPCAKENACGAA